MTTMHQDGTRDIKGVDEKPKTREPRKLGRMEGPGMQAPEIIGHGMYADGQDRMGTPSGSERRDAGTNRYADGEQHRAGLRSSAYPGK